MVKQSSYDASPTQETTRGPGNWGGEGAAKSMGGAPAVGGMLGGLFGGLLGGSQRGNTTPNSVKALMPQGGGGLLGGLLGGARYTGLRDMFNGGGPGRAGEQFYGGGAMSAALNRAGVRPLGYSDLMGQMAAQRAQKVSQPGYTPTGYGAAPAGGSGPVGGGYRASPTPVAPTPTGGLVVNLGAPITGSGMTPANAYATAPAAQLGVGQSGYAGSALSPTGLTGPAAVAASQAAYAEMVARIEAQAREQAAAARAEAERRAREQAAAARAEAERRAREIYQGMMVAP